MDDLFEEFNDLYVVIANGYDVICYISDLLDKEIDGRAQGIGREVADLFDTHILNRQLKGWVMMKKNNREFVARRFMRTYGQQNYWIYNMLPKHEILRIHEGISIFESSRVQIQELINCIADGIHITDGEGNTLMINDEAERVGVLSRQELIGRNMKELEKKGYVDEAVSPKVMASGKEEVILQRTMEGYELMVTGIPHKTEDGIDYIVTTERNVTSLNANSNRLHSEKRKLMEDTYTYIQENKMVISSHSESMVQVVDLAKKVAPTDVTVLIQGESGTGKEGIADIVTKYSKRHAEPFIKINCSAIPKDLLESELFGYEKGAFTGANPGGKVGLFELAHKGTIFLDEIGEMSLELQPKLLRVLQEREIMRIGGSRYIPINVRIIAATNMDLLNKVKSGEFRSDLYYRLNVIPIYVPPLRERKTEIPLLASHFKDMFNIKYNMEVELDKEALCELVCHDWPGNIRELENFMERLVITTGSGVVSREQVKEQFEYGKAQAETQVEASGDSWTDLMEAYEKKLLQEALSRGENVSQMAKHFQMDRSTVSRKLKKYQLLA